jgi:hypothetical protein
MQTGKALDDAADLVADGMAIDWEALARSATTHDERVEIECLRIIDALARAHKSGDWDALGPPHPQPVRQDSPAGAQAAAAAGASTWGRFRLLQEVGAGAFGSVHRAWDPDLERELAIKILHRHVDDADLRGRILHEGRALARVRDPHVVSVLGVESVDDQVGLCMEFVEGDTLDALLRTHGTLNAGEAALWGQDVCRALSAVHLAGFVHRDVKPRNVMRDRTGRIVLMDFGTGQDLYRLTAEDRWRIAGTPPYMAPEVLAGQPATVASDVYSVGVLLYHLVTATYPVEGRTLDEIKAAHMQGRRTPLGERRPDLPLSFRQIVDRAVSARPDDRWSSSAAMLDALGQFLANVDANRHPIARRVAMAAASALGLGLVLASLGAISSKYFNTFVLGRENFVDESVWEWMYWGALSLTAPLVLFMLAVLGLSLLLVTRRLLLGVSASARRLDRAAESVARRLQLDDVPMASGWALLTATAVLLAAWWACLPTLSMLIGLYPDNVSTAPVDKLAFLTPVHQFREHENYRVWFTWSTILSGAVWVPVLRLAGQRGQRVSRLMLLGGAVVFLLSAALLDLPFRAFSQNELETAEWKGRPCYVLGERETDVLVFCPDLDPPRSSTVPKDADDLRRLGVTENVFTRFPSTP